MKEVLAVSGWVCCDEDTVLNEVLTVDWDAGMAFKEGAICRDGFMNNDGRGSDGAGPWGLINGSFTFEIFVNFEDLPFSLESLCGLFRALPCKERWVLTSALLLVDWDVTDGDRDLDDDLDDDLDVALGDGGVTKSSSSPSVGDPGSSVSTCKAPITSRL